MRLTFTPLPHEPEPDPHRRRSFGEDFLGALRADFAAHGRDVIAKLRNDKPADYLKVIAALLPKHADTETPADADPFGRLSDADLAQTLAEVRALRGPGGAAD